MTISKYLLLFLGVIGLLGCEKRPETLEEYLPEVEIISAEKTAEGKIEVRARLLSKGPRDLYYLGFCADSVPHPEINSNQILTPYLSGDEFVAVIGNTFFPGTYSQLYVNAFAANDFTYNTATPVFVDSTGNVGIQPEITIPCDLNLNEVQLTQNMGFQTYSDISPVEVSEGISTFFATVNTNLAVRFSFTDLGERIYTSASSAQDIDDQKMLVRIIQFGNENSIMAGANIYVKHIENNTFDIVICGANWGFNSTMKTRVRVSE